MDDDAPLAYAAAIIAIVIALICCAILPDAPALKFLACVLAAVIVYAAATTAGHLERPAILFGPPRTPTPLTPPPQPQPPAQPRARAMRAAAQSETPDAPPDAPPAIAPPAIAPPLTTLFSQEQSARADALAQMCSEVQVHHDPDVEPYTQEEAPEGVTAEQSAMRSVAPSTAQKTFSAVTPHFEVDPSFQKLYDSFHTEDKRREELTRAYSNTPDHVAYARALNNVCIDECSRMDKERKKNHGGLQPVLSEAS
jgi:hypothetical protein